MRVISFAPFFPVFFLCSSPEKDETLRREVKIDEQRSIFDELRGVSCGDETMILGEVKDAK